MAVYQNLTLTQLSQDVQNNTSQVRILWQSTQTGNSYNHIANPATYWVMVNGGTEFGDTASCILPWRDTGTLADVVITVKHDEKGEATVTVRTWMDTKISAGVVELSQTLVLDTIPRASTVSASDGVIGGISHIAVGRRNPSFSHSLQFNLGQLDGYVTAEGAVASQEARLYQESVQFLLPDSFYEAMIESADEICTLTCRTYADDTLIGDPQTGAFTVFAQESVCRPLLQAIAEDINPQTLALTNDPQRVVKGFSTLQCKMNAQGQKGAYIRQKRIGDTLLADDQTELTVFGAEGAVTFSVTDSRGYQASFTPQLTVVPYVRPTVKTQLNREHPTDGTALLTLSGTWFDGSFGAENNHLQVQYRIDNGPWQTLTPQLQPGAYQVSAHLQQMDYTRVYTLQIAVTDALCTLEKTLTLKKSTPVFDWGENDFCFHVPVSMDQMPQVGGKSLLDVIYPVGTVYASAIGEDPAGKFGGVWTALTADTQNVYQWLRIS